MSRSASNANSQVSLLENTLYTIPEYMRDAAIAGWTGVFANDLFPLIDGSIFDCLFTDNDIGRPHLPNNVMFGAHLIAKLNNLTPEELVFQMQTNIAYQYALHCNDCFDAAAFSLSSFNRFRWRLDVYMALTGEDLVKKAILDIAEKTKGIMGVSDILRRVDSTLIESNIKDLGRPGLIYKTNYALINALNLDDEGKAALEKAGLSHYLDSNDYNIVIYHNEEGGVDPVPGLLKDIDSLLKFCGCSYENLVEFKIFSAMVKQQTVVENGVRRLSTAKDGTMHSGMIQSPFDPDCTFNGKNGKDHKGFTVLAVESVGENGTVISSYDVQPNNVGDASLLEQQIESEPVHEKQHVIVSDAAFISDRLIALAGEKNITLVATDLTGRETPQVFAGFVIGEDGQLEHCAFEKTPLRQSAYKNGTIRAVFSGDHCGSCPFHDQCHPKKQANTWVRTVSSATIARATLAKSQDSALFNDYRRLRNGIETVPSQLKRGFHIDHKTRGLIRTSRSVGLSVGCVNFRKLSNFRRGRGKYAHNSLIRELTS